jgi:hypothetical protein
MKHANGNVKCDCGHTRKHHIGMHPCNGKKCSCEWYHPNVNWIKKQKEISLAEIRLRRYGIIKKS